MITCEELSSLREDIRAKMSEKRYLHTLGVERAAQRIGLACLPEKVTELCAAALLHDVVKEAPIEDQISLMGAWKEPLTEEDYESKALYHAFAAPMGVKKYFPHFATDDILSAVFLHTSGGANMSVFDEIIFVADFVEDGRAYDACRESRECFFEALDVAKTRDEKLRVLHSAVLQVIDFTVAYLEKVGKNVNSRMILARRAIASKII